jgi:hypothetical protein
LKRLRTTLDQGLTFKQIFYEVYSDQVEKYLNKTKRYDRGRPIIDDYGGDILKAVEYDYEHIYWKIKYLRRTIRQVRKTDDEFRWLSTMPVKRNQINKQTGKKVRPYLEYRYINIKASQTPELLEQINEYWSKRLDAIDQGLKKKIHRLEAIEQATSTPEGERQHSLAQDALTVFKDLEYTFLTPDRKYKDGKNTYPQIDKMVAELKRDGRLPQQYKTDYDYIRKILKTDIINRQAIKNLLSSGELSFNYYSSGSRDTDDYFKQHNEVRKQAYKLMKDAIEAYCNKKQVEKQPVTKENKYDSEALDYR